MICNKIAVDIEKIKGVLYYSGGCIYLENVNNEKKKEICKEIIKVLNNNGIKEKIEITDDIHIMNRNRGSYIVDKRDYITIIKTIKITEDMNFFMYLTDETLFFQKLKPYTKFYTLSLDDDKKLETNYTLQKLRLQEIDNNNIKVIEYIKQIYENSTPMTVKIKINRLKEKLAVG